MGVQTGRVLVADWRGGGEPTDEIDWRRAASIWLALALVGGCATAWHFAGASRPPPERPAIGSPALDQWTRAALPPLIEIPGWSPAGSAPRLGIRVDAARGARRDAYALGDLAADAAAARIEAWIGADGGGGPLFVELAEQASRFDAAISKFGLPREIRTTRGVVEYAELALRGPAGARSCVGFRLASADLAGLRGFLCSPGSDKPVEIGLACLIEDFELTEDGRESGLARVLEGAPARRRDCRDAPS